jgi:hypothetical protein
VESKFILFLSLFCSCCSVCLFCMRFVLMFVSFVSWVSWLGVAVRKVAIRLHLCDALPTTMCTFLPLALFV